MLASGRWSCFWWQCRLVPDQGSDCVSLIAVTCGQTELWRVQAGYTILLYAHPGSLHQCLVHHSFAVMFYQKLCAARDLCKLSFDRQRVQEILFRTIFNEVDNCRIICPFPVIASFPNIGTEHCAHGNILKFLYIDDSPSGILDSSAEKNLDLQYLWYAWLYKKLLILAQSFQCKHGLLNVGKLMMQSDFASNGIFS